MVERRRTARKAGGVALWVLTGVGGLMGLLCVLILGVIAALFLFAEDTDCSYLDGSDFEGVFGGRFEYFEQGPVLTGPTWDSHECYARRPGEPAMFRLGRRHYKSTEYAATDFSRDAAELTSMPGADGATFRQDQSDFGPGRYAVVMWQGNERVSLATMRISEATPEQLTHLLNLYFENFERRD